MVWIGCPRYEKLESDFVARTFALIAPVPPILHRVYCRSEKFLVQWGGLGAFIAKNSDMASWHELLQ